jgi:NADPH-dependent glutamate synthase beta subunit-like oxidoreductase
VAAEEGPRALLDPLWEKGIHAYFNATNLARLDDDLITRLCELHLDAPGLDLLERSRARWDPEREPLPLETSMAGVFAAGDVRRGSIKRVASGVGEGATVVRLVHEHLREHEYGRAAR